MFVLPPWADSSFAPSLWETSLQSNAVSHWLGTNLESALCLSFLRSRPVYRSNAGTGAWMYTEETFSNYYNNFTRVWKRCSFICIGCNFPGFLKTIVIYYSKHWSTSANLVILVGIAQMCQMEQSYMTCKVLFMFPDWNPPQQQSPSKCLCHRSSFWRRFVTYAIFLLTKFSRKHFDP